MTEGEEKEESTTKVLYKDSWQIYNVLGALAVLGAKLAEASHELQGDLEVALVSDDGYYYLRMWDTGAPQRFALDFSLADMLVEVLDGSALKEELE